MLTFILKKQIISTWKFCSLVLDLGVCQVVGDTRVMSTFRVLKTCPTFFTHFLLLIIALLKFLALRSNVLLLFITDNHKRRLEGIHRMATERHGETVQVHGETCWSLVSRVSWYLSQMDSQKLSQCSCRLLCQVYTC